MTRPFYSRKQPAHGVHEPRGASIIVFVTVCTKNRETWLANHQVHSLLRMVWTEADAWLAGRYMIMPDHIHLFAAPGAQDLELDTWVKYWKSRFTRLHQTPNHQWQRSHWDTRIRTGESYDSKWDYVQHNPVRHGLTQNPADWPFQGAIELRW